MQYLKTDIFWPNRNRDRMNFDEGYFSCMLSVVDFCLADCRIKGRLRKQFRQVKWLGTKALGTSPADCRQRWNYFRRSVSHAVKVIEVIEAMNLWVSCDGDGQDFVDAIEKFYQ